MNIDPTNNPQITGDARRVNGSSQRQRVESPTQAKAADSSSTKSTARVDNSRDIDTARVAEIRQAIKNGSLDLQPHRIAEGILASARELTGQ